MSTRGTMGVRIDGQDKLAYNHSDSYPDGLGEDLVKVIREAVRTGTIPKLAEQARALQVVETDKRPTEEQKEALKEYANLSVGKQSPDDWYCLLRATQGDLLLTLKAGYISSEGQNFILGSLFCEWGYILNFDTNTLEIYRGFQTAPHSLGRYATKGTPKPSYSGGDTYYPCALIAEYPFDAIPEDWAAQVEPSDEEVEA